MSAITLGTAALVAVALNPSPTSSNVTEARERISAESERRAAEEAELEALLARCLGAPTRDAATDCGTESLGSEVFPYDPLGDSLPYCWTSAGDQPLDTCTYGSESDDALRIALVGDSHARHLMPGLEPQARERNWTIHSFFGNGCSLTTQPLDACALSGQQTLQTLTEGEPFDVVVVSVSRRKRVEEVPVTEAIQRVQATGAKVVVMEDVPTTTPEAVECAHAANAETAVKCGVTTEGMKPDVMVALAETLPGVAIGRIMPYLCDTDWCPSVIGNVVVSVDEGAHLTATYSRSLGPYVASAIAAAAGP